MVSDHLSEALDLIAVRGVVSGGAAASGRWTAESTVDGELKFCAIVRGRAALMTDGLDAPITMVEGEVALLNARTWLSLSGGGADGPVTVVEQPANGEIARHDASDSGGSDIFIGGRIELDAAGHELLFEALPQVAHLPASSPASARVRSTIDRLFDEITTARPGAKFAVREYSQLLILDVLRAFAGQTAVSAGWLRLLGDERLRPALDLIHGQPEVGWGLNELARAAAMSRTGFAVRFREVAGMPPLTYLVRWRMLLAKRELRSPDSRMRLLALQLGYSSESSFSSAFKRSVGESPQRYRTRMLAQRASDPSASSPHHTSRPARSPR